MMMAICADLCRLFLRCASSALHTEPAEERDCESQQPKQA